MDQNNHDKSPSSNHPSGPQPATSQPEPQPVPVYLPAPQEKSKKSPFPILGKVLKLFIIFGLVSLLIADVAYRAFMTGGMEQQTYRSGEPMERIALINLEGMIDMTLAENVRQALKKAMDDELIKGVILVVNSPGGYVVPSDMLNQYITSFRENSGKPIYSYAEQLNASGAYWASVATEKIYAQENTTVGSIGVIMYTLVFEKAMKEKLGIEPVVIESSRSPGKDRGNPFRMPTEQEKQKYLDELDLVHERFVKTVSEGRDLAMDEVWPLATGEVFDGVKARDKNLIDEIGFLDDVIVDMADRLHLEKPMVVRYIKPASLRQMLAGQSSQSLTLDFKQQLEQFAMTPRIQALWLGN